MSFLCMFLVFNPTVYSDVCQSVKPCASCAIVSLFPLSIYQPPWPVYIYEALSLYRHSSFLLDVVSAVNCVRAPEPWAFLSVVGIMPLLTNSDTKASETLLCCHDYSQLTIILNRIDSVCVFCTYISDTYLLF